MNQIIKILKSTAIFADISEEEIENEILPRGRIIDVPKGNYLINFQERFDYFGMIIKGRLNIMYIYGNGHYGITGVLEDASLFGVELICSKSRISPYYAVAMQQTQVISFPAELIMSSGVLPEDIRIRILQSTLAYVADENMRKEYRLAILFQKGLRERIMTYLTMQANKRKTNNFTIPFTRDEMASFLCVNRTRLSHELSLMEKEGIIKFNRNNFTLLNWDNGNGDY